MEIVKYTKAGQQREHDIHYIHENKLLRYASDEEAPEAVKRTFNALTEYAADTIAGLSYMKISRIEWKRKDGNTTVKITGTSGARNGETLKVELPEFGYHDGEHKNELTGQWEKYTKEIDCDMTGVKLIKTLESALAQYVKDGAGQLQFSFEEEQSRNLNEKIVQLQR